MKRLIFLGAMPIICLLLSISGNAAENTSQTVLSGVIKKVDFQSNTLTVVNDKTGNQERYRFDYSTRVFKGEIKSSRDILKSGQTVILKLPTAAAALANAN